MGLNDTPQAERIHIGLFGKRNSGKSSLINAITGQKLAIVSDMMGTTTDPVYKSMELLPLGPVVFIDTPGLDDQGELGRKRVEKGYQVLNKTDIAVIVIDGKTKLDGTERHVIELCKKKNIPYIFVVNKMELLTEVEKASWEQFPEFKENGIFVSAEKRENIFELKEMIGHRVKSDSVEKKIIGDLLEPNDVVVLVIPIDTAAPKGRLILPEQSTIRDIIDAGAVAMVTRDTELKQTLKALEKPPKLVITDSQVYKTVKDIVPEEILLTSFSVLFARYKGNLKSLVEGCKGLSKLKDGDTVLISEGCTHHRQCDDIGTVKMPKWIQEYTGKTLKFEFTSGTEFPMDLSDFSQIVHCGGCMLNEREVKYRIACAEDQNAYMTNYGICIAYMNGILERCLRVFPELHDLL